MVLEEHRVQDQGLNLALGTVSNWLCDTDQGHLPFLDPLGAHLGTLPSPECQNVLDAWWTLNCQLGGGAEKGNPTSVTSHCGKNGGQEQKPSRKQPETLCLQGLETVLWVPVGAPLQGSSQPSTM